jgi:heme-degrading monooxygenase HmoA
MIAPVPRGAQPYSYSTWRVKPGYEEDFIRRWHDLADWSAAQGLTETPTLLRDVDDPTRFVSFGPWESIETIRRWRSAAGFHERVARLNEVLDGFEPRTLEVVTRR